MKRILMFFVIGLMIMSATIAYADMRSDNLINALSDISDVYDISDEEDITWRNVIDVASELTGKYSTTKNATVILLDKKIISSVPDMKKKPTVEEISKVFVKILGYDPYVKNDDYAAYAYSLKLFDKINVKTDSTMKGNEFKDFLYNVFKTKVVEVEMVNSVSGKAANISDKNLLYDRYSILKKTGVVTATSNTTLTGVSDIGENYIEIDGIEYLKGKLDADKYLGKKVDFYYIEDEDYDEYTLIDICENDKNKTEEIQSKYILKYENRSYEYETKDSDKTKTIRLSDNASFIYNGFAAGINSLSKEELMPKSGRVIAIDNNGDNRYECIFIYDTVPVMLKKADPENEKLTFDYGYTYNDTYSLDLSDDKFKGEYKLFDIDLNEISFDSLQPRSVVSIGKAKNGDYVIISSSLKGIGEITSMLEGEEISITGVKYDLSKYYQRAETSEIKLGSFGNFYFDYNYEIVAFVCEDTSNNMGYLVRAYYDDDSGDEPVAMLKVFNSRGAFEKVELADKVTVYSNDYVNGIRMDKERAVAELETNSLIVYDISANKVKKIYLTLNDEEMEYSTADYPILLNKTVINSGNKLQESRLYQGLMGGKYRVPKTTLIFSIPVDKSREDQYRVYYGSVFPTNGDKYFTNTIKLYNIDKFMKINIILEEKKNTSASVSASNEMYVVDKIMSGLDDEDSEVLQLVCYCEDGEKILYTSDFELTSSSDVWGKDVVITELKSGDVIQASANEDGAINGFRVLFEGQYPGEYRMLNVEGNTLSVNNINDFALFYGKTVGIDDNAIIQNCVGDGRDKKNNMAQLTNNIKNYPTSFFMFDTKTKKVSQITLDDIEENDELMIRRTYTSVNMVYKIKK